MHILLTISIREQLAIRFICNYIFSRTKHMYLCTYNIFSNFKLISRNRILSIMTIKLSTFSFKCLVYIQCLLVLLLNSCEFLDAAPRGRSKKKTADTHSSGIKFIIGLLILVVIPPIFYFIYSVMKDPVTPELVQRLKEEAKSRTFGYLSSRKKENTETSKDV